MCYPPGVTGNEWQICGSGYEDKCERCLEVMDDLLPSQIPDGEVFIDDEFLCAECVLDGSN